MKVKSKFNINRTFLASLSVMVDKTYDDDKEWWRKSEKFVNDVIDMDFAQLSPAQKNWLTSIQQKLRLEGM